MFVFHHSPRILYRILNTFNESDLKTNPSRPLFPSSRLQLYLLITPFEDPKSSLSPSNWATNPSLTSYHVPSCLERNTHGLLRLRRNRGPLALRSYFHQNYPNNNLLSKGRIDCRP
jgi:hypothetical protein